MELDSDDILTYPGVCHYFRQAAIGEMDALAELRQIAGRQQMLFQHNAYMASSMATDWSNFHRTVGFAGSLTGMIQQRFKDKCSSAVLKKITVTAVRDRLKKKQKKSLKLVRAGDSNDDDDNGDDSDLPATRRGAKPEEVSYNTKLSVGCSTKSNHFYLPGRSDADHKGRSGPMDVHL